MLICPHCNAHLIGAFTAADYARHIARCPAAPDLTRFGARMAADHWRDPRPEAEQALRLSVGLRQPWGRA